MTNWQDDVAQILRDKDVSDLARSLIVWTQELSAPNEDTRVALDAILQDVTKELPVHRAIRIAFYLGAAWQRSTA